MLYLQHKVFSGVEFGMQEKKMNTQAKVGKAVARSCSSFSFRLVVFKNNRKHMQQDPCQLFLYIHTHE